MAFLCFILGTFREESVCSGKWFKERIILLGIKPLENGKGIRCDENTKFLQ
jgi:hypothetical protein